MSRMSAFAAQELYSALVTVPNWQSLPVTVAAQDVQHSAYPSAYAKRQPLAETLLHMAPAKPPTAR